MAKDPPPIGTIENVAMGVKLAGEEKGRPHTRFALEKKLQGDNPTKKGSIGLPVATQRLKATHKEAVRSYDAPEALSRELSLVKGGLDKILGRLVSFLYSYNPNMTQNAFEVSALFSAFIIFSFEDPVTEETRRFMKKYVEVLLEKVEDRSLKDIVLNFGKMLEDRASVDSQLPLKNQETKPTKALPTRKTKEKQDTKVDKIPCEEF
jgi:hypothetical protein